AQGRATSTAVVEEHAKRLVQPEVGIVVPAERSNGEASQELFQAARAKHMLASRPRGLDDVDGRTGNADAHWTSARKERWRDGPASAQVARATARSDMPTGGPKRRSRRSNGTSQSLIRAWIPGTARRFRIRAFRNQPGTPSML